MKRKRLLTKETKIVILLVLFAIAAFPILSRYEFLSSDSGITSPLVPPFGIVIDIPPGGEVREIYHVHADFLVVVNGREIDFSRPEFDYVNPAIHIHTQNYKGGHVLHVESRNATLGDFFSSVGMRLESTCFYTGLEEYCNNDTHSMKFYANGIENEEFGNYKPGDIDRILVSYGIETNLTEQIDSVTDLACIFSEKCATPPEAENQIFYN